MRILHTSDWHLGKHLGEYSRLIEQEAFIDELTDIVETREIDLILVAGDVYDTANPPANAERLFFDAMKRLGKGGQRPVIVVAGNHDNPARLTASSTLVTEMGIIMFGMPGAIVPTGDFEHFSIKDSGEGFVELEISGERAVILAMPYPSEKRLNEILGGISDEHSHQLSYSERIGEIFTGLSEKYRQDTVNLAVGHFYVKGGESSGSERDISLGGGYAVSPEALPNMAQYVALGHLHRPQRAGSPRAFYSGSPIAYDVSESGYAKCVYIADILPGLDCTENIEKVYLRCYKPFILIEAGSIAEAVEKITAESGKCWMTIKINVQRQLTHSEIKEIRATNGEILEIICDVDSTQEGLGLNSLSLSESVIEPKKEFVDFYGEKRGVKPSKELTELFLELINMSDGGDS